MRDLSDPISRQQTITALRALSDEDGYINAPHEVVTDVVRGLAPVKAKQGQTTRSEQTKTDKLGVKTGETYKDTISRQALCEYALNQKDKSVAPNDIMRFPSAQPEQPERCSDCEWWTNQPEIIRCKDCGHWTQSTGKMKGYGLGRCDFHDADLVTCNGFCYWAERREE